MDKTLFYAIYLIGISAFQFIPFIVYAWDKMQAKRGKQRVPEMTLVLLTFLFGGLGSVASMFLFCHKVKKTSFIAKFIIAWGLRFGVLCVLAYILFIL